MTARPRSAERTSASGVYDPAAGDYRSGDYWTIGKLDRVDWKAGKVYLVGSPNPAMLSVTRVAVLRYRKGSKVEILDIRTDDTDRARAKSNAADTLVKHPDVAALVGLWSYNGPAILNAVRPKPVLAR